MQQAPSRVARPHSSGSAAPCSVREAWAWLPLLPLLLTLPRAELRPFSAAPSAAAVLSRAGNCCAGEAPAAPGDEASPEPLAAAPAAETSDECAAAQLHIQRLSRYKGRPQQPSPTGFEETATGMSPFSEGRPSTSPTASAPAAEGSRKSPELLEEADETAAELLRAAAASVLRPAARLGHSAAPLAPQPLEWPAAPVRQEDLDGHDAEASTELRHEAAAILREAALVQEGAIVVIRQNARLKKANARLHRKLMLLQTHATHKAADTTRPGQHAIDATTLVFFLIGSSVAVACAMLCASAAAVKTCDALPASPASSVGTRRRAPRLFGFSMRTGDDMEAWSGSDHRDSSGWQVARIWCWCCEGLFHSLEWCCCGCSQTTRLVMFAELVVFGIGMAVLWHLGWVQPVLKEVAVYVYIVFGFIAALMLLLIEGWQHIQNMLHRGFKGLDFVHERIDALHRVVRVDSISGLPQQVRRQVCTNSAESSDQDIDIPTTGQRPSGCC